MTHRAQHFLDHGRAGRYIQRAVESRRRGDVEQIRLFRSRKTCITCPCGYTSTKLPTRCPLCGRAFANDRSTLNAAISAAH